MEDYSDALKIFFAPKVYKQLLDYEKTVYRNMMKDFWVKLEHGLCPTMPNFMQHVHIRSKGDHSENEDGCTGEEKEHNRTGCSSDLDNQSKKDRSGSYVCRICGCYRKEARAFWRHVMMHDAMRHIGAHIDCGICQDRVFIEADTLRCFVCGEVFQTREELLHDQRLHTAVEIILCSICDVSFADEDSYQTHLSIYHDDGYSNIISDDSDIEVVRINLTCKICGWYEMTDCDVLEKDFECTMCRECYTDENTEQCLLSADVRKSNRSPRMVQSYFCDVCGMLYETKTELETHAKSHVNMEKYLCIVCNGEFTKLSHLNKHLQVHSSNRSFNCAICNQQFSQKFTFEIHIRSHNFKYRCEECHEAFVQESELQKHKISVHASESFVCKICDKPFSSSYALEVHLKMHLKDVSAMCHVCDKMVSVKSLFAHMKLHGSQ